MMNKKASSPFVYMIFVLIILFTGSAIFLNYLSDNSEANFDVSTDTTLYDTLNIIIYEVNSSFIHYFANQTISIVGFEIGVPVINIFAILGETGKEYITNSLISLSYLPDFISVPVIIIILIIYISFIFFIINLIISAIK